MQFETLRQKALKTGNARDYAVYCKALGIRGTNVENDILNGEGLAELAEETFDSDLENWAQTQYEPQTPRISVAKIERKPLTHAEKFLNIAKNFNIDNLSDESGAKRKLLGEFFPGECGDLSDYSDADVSTKLREMFLGYKRNRR